MLSYELLWETKIALTIIEDAITQHPVQRLPAITYTILDKGAIFDPITINDIIQTTGMDLILFYDGKTITSP